MEIFFYLFAGLVLIASLMVISSKNPVYSVLWLIFAFCNSAGLMILLGAEFLAMMLIVIYVGAVAVLFLFIVMMLDTNIKQEIFVAFNKRDTILLASFLFIDLLLTIFLSIDSGNSCTQSGFGIPTSVTNVAAIGELLYTDFILPFQIAGIILFVAMIASISLAMREGQSNAKRQNPRLQLMRGKENGMEIIKVENNKGVSGIRYE
jgi:NADH-quinone oxidoreductase subunit J